MKLVFKFITLTLSLTLCGTESVLAQSTNPEGTYLEYFYFEGGQKGCDEMGGEWLSDIRKCLVFTSNATVITKIANTDNYKISLEAVSSNGQKTCSIDEIAKFENSKLIVNILGAESYPENKDCKGIFTIGDNSLSFRFTDGCVWTHCKQVLGSSFEALKK